MQQRTRLDLFQNPHYDHGPLLKRMAWTISSGLFFQTWFPWPSTIKAALLRTFGAKIGKGLVIKPRVTIKYPWHLTIKDHVWIGENVWIDNLGKVTIGNHCCISQGALLLCGNHNYKIPTFDLMVGDITLEDGVWVGAKGQIAPATTLHSHAILTLGSTLTHDAEPYTIYQGNPAIAIKKRELTPPLTKQS